MFIYAGNCHVGMDGRDCIARHCFMTPQMTTINYKTSSVTSQLFIIRREVFKISRLVTSYTKGLIHWFYVQFEIYYINIMHH